MPSDRNPLPSEGSQLPSKHNQLPFEGNWFIKKGSPPPYQENRLPFLPNQLGFAPNQLPSEGNWFEFPGYAATGLALRRPWPAKRGSSTVTAAWAPGWLREAAVLREL